VGSGSRQGERASAAGLAVADLLFGSIGGKAASFLCTIRLRGSLSSWLGASRAGILFLKGDDKIHTPSAAPSGDRFDANAGLDPFRPIKPERVGPEVAQAIAEHRLEIEAICQSNDRSFAGVLLAKEAADRALSEAWSMIGHVQAVANTPALRAAHAKAEQKLSAHGLWVSQNRALYDAIAACPGWDEGEWSAAQCRLRTLSLRDFVLSGVALEGGERDRFREIALELTRLSTEFADAVLDATDAFHLDVGSKKTLDGIPAGDVARFRGAASEAGVKGWRIGLSGPDLQAVMTYARSRRLRKAIYEASSTRASDQGPQAGTFDNSARIERIMTLRHEMARLLGFESSADRSLETKMAASPQEVEDFLLGILPSARAAARSEIEQVREAAAEIGIRRLQPWDVAYVSEQLRRRLFDFDAEEVRPYFPADRATSGVMEIISRLFDIRFRLRTDAGTWHEDARFYDVLDRNGAVIAGVYLDLFARPGKRGGAWMDVCRHRFNGLGQAHRPVAFLTCNFAGPSNGEPATLRHREVETLLHEFGHVLHHILTEVDYPSIGGIGGVEWDAVELPSQLMENFAWDYSALSLLSGHVETGETLPQDLFDRMQSARNFQAGLHLVRQLELALFDVRLHRDYDPAKGARALEILARVRGEVAVMEVPGWNRFPHAFTHIFAGGYSAGYYSYLWAELLSADAFDRFREAGVMCAQTGGALRREILARGATRPAAENFVAFRGRQPEPRALLRSYGLAA
jgi:oligopeptidase A